MLQELVAERGMVRLAESGIPIVLRSRYEAEGFWQLECWGDRVILERFRYGKIAILHPPRADRLVQTLA